VDRRLSGISAPATVIAAFLGAGEDVLFFRHSGRRERSDQRPGPGRRARARTCRARSPLTHFASAPLRRRPVPGLRSASPGM